MWGRRNCGRWQRSRFVDRNEMKGLYTLLRCSAAICKITSESPTDVLEYFWNWPVTLSLSPSSFMTLSSGDGNSLFLFFLEVVFCKLVFVCVYRCKRFICVYIRSSILYIYIHEAKKSALNSCDCKQTRGQKSRRRLNGLWNGTCKYGLT